MFLSLLQSLINVDSIQGLAPKIDLSLVKLTDLSLIKIEHLAIGRREDGSASTSEESKRSPEILLASSGGEAQTISLPPVEQTTSEAPKVVVSDVLPYRLHPFYSFGSEAIQSPPLDFVLADRLRFYVPKPVQPRRVELRFFSADGITLEFQTEDSGVADDGATEYPFRVGQTFTIRHFRSELKRLQLDEPAPLPVQGGTLFKIESSSFTSAFYLKATHDRHPDEHHIVAFI